MHTKEGEKKGEKKIGKTEVQRMRRQRHKVRKLTHNAREIKRADKEKWENERLKKKGRTKEKRVKGKKEETNKIMAI